jgi:predicted TIM-barrel fold metal-dependent hydrolase
MDHDSFEIIDCHAHIFSHVHAGLVPESLGGDTFSAQQLVSLMEAEGVSKAVLLQNPAIGTVNDDIAAAIEACPGRFVGVIQVDPRAPDALQQKRRYASHARHRTLKFEMSAG